jgi:hypothetical protein
VVIYPRYRKRKSVHLLSGRSGLSVRILKGRRKNMKTLPTLVVMSVVIAWAAGPTLAILTPPDIEGTSTATLIVGEPYDGWYRYDVEITWDLNAQGAGLSHWDFVLKTGCAEPDHLIEFDPAVGNADWAGYSNNGFVSGPPWEFGWVGYFERTGDTSVTPQITDPVVKYNDAYDLDGGADNPGAEGYGIFTFYANIIPEYGTYTDVLVAKSGLGEARGDLEGAYPSCQDSLRGCADVERCRFSTRLIRPVASGGLGCPESTGKGVGQ